MSGEAEHGRRFDTGAGAAGDVVQHQREARRVGDAQEVRLHGLLRRTAVVRRHHQEAVRPRLFGGPRQGDGVPGVGAAHARDDLGPVADLLAHGPYERGLLGVRGGGGLSRGAVQDQPVTALGHEMTGELAGACQIQFSGGGERRDHRAEGAAEGAWSAHGGQCPST